MARHHETLIPNVYERRIEKLEEDLRASRETILAILPEKLSTQLRSYYSCENREETYAWTVRVQEEILAAAKVVEKIYRAEALCPLCGDGANNHYREGFSFPLGLERHLTGRGNAPRCAVMDAAMALARDYWERQFSAAEVAEKDNKRREKIARAKTDMVYRYDLFDPPELIDEISPFSEPRTPEQMQWAEDRLKDLGFDIRTDGNVRSYIIDAESHVVYADPRVVKTIKFRVFKKPLPNRRLSRPGSSCAHFDLQDSWKHDLRSKFEKRLADADSRNADDRDRRIVDLGRDQSQ
jgi:hypothetical protein